MPDPEFDSDAHADPTVGVNPQDPVHTTSPAATQYASTPAVPAPDVEAKKSNWVAYAEALHGAGAAKGLSKKQIIERFAPK